MRCSRSGVFPGDSNDIDWTGYLTGLAWSPDGTTLAAGGIEIASPTMTVRPPTSTPMQEPSPTPTPTSSPTSMVCPHPYWSSTMPEGARARLEKLVVMDLAVSPDGEYFAAAGIEGDWGYCDMIVVLYRINDFKEVWSYRSNEITIDQIAFSPDGQSLTVGFYGQTIHVLETAGGTRVKSFEDRWMEFLSDMQWSPDGSLLAVGLSDSTAVLWDVVNEKIFSTLGGDPNHTDKSHQTPVYLDWSPDGTRIEVGTDRGKISIFDPKSSQALLMFHVGTYSTQEYDRTGYPTGLALSPDGKILAAGKHNTIILWDPQSGKVRSSLWGHSFEVTALAWSPDGKILASGDGYYDNDGTVILWDVSTRKILKKFQGHHGFFVTAVDWTKDGKTVLSGSPDGSLILWNAE